MWRHGTQGLAPVGMDGVVVIELRQLKVGIDSNQDVGHICLKSNIIGHVCLRMAHG